MELYILITFRPTDLAVLENQGFLSTTSMRRNTDFARLSGVVLIFTRCRSSALFGW